MKHALGATLLVASLVVQVATSGPAGACPTASQRIGGGDRIDTAVLASQAGFGAGGSAKGAVLATAAAFPDALAGGPLAAHATGPLLLTGAAGLDRRTADELRRAVAPGAVVYLLGGLSALSAGVEASVRQLGFVARRLAGADRYTTAVAVAHELGDPPVAYLATGVDFPDGIVAGAVAGRHPGAIVLSVGDQLPPATADYLTTKVTVYAFGDQAAKALPRATAVAGADRYATALAAAKRFFGSTGGLPLDDSVPRSLAVATGRNFPDALAGGPYLAAVGGGPLLLSPPDALPAGVAEYLGQHAGSLTHAAILGSADVVSANVKSDVDRILITHCGF
ncbi:MAG: protease-like protein [Actinomycetia bacterium]|nr:protease-like protein [Actinomycetes bacterium]